MSNKVDITRLITIRHYSEFKRVVRETVMQRIRKGDLSYVIIDGMYFVLLTDNEFKEYERKNAV